MKAMMMSIRPKWIAKILNKEKTLEIRKRFPSDYVGWVYIYCTKDKKYANLINRGGFLTGMVVARFWCNKVEEIKLNLVFRYSTETMKEEELLKRSCLTVDEIDNYLWSNICCGKAIHITKLKIFDKPKEISEFRKPIEYTKYCNRNCSNCDYAGFNNKTQKWEFECSITRAPQSYCFIEI